ncbi:MAG: hypothetical protein V2A58_11270 [Planctomycetota bacterium]
MRTSFRSMVLFLSSFLLYVFLGSPAPADEAAVEVIDVNGSFEKTEVFTKYEEQYRKWIKDGIELPDPFTKPKGWHPQSHPDPKWRIELVEDEAAAHSGKNFLHIYAGTVHYYDWPFSTLTLNDGDEVTICVFVKGPQDVENPFRVRFFLYGFNKEGKKVNIYDDGEKGDVIITGVSSPEWKEFTGTYVVAAHDAVDVPSHVRAICPALVGKDVSFDDVKLTIKRAASASKPSQ